MARSGSFSSRSCSSPVAVRAQARPTTKCSTVQDMWEIDQIEKDFHQATIDEGHRPDDEPVRAQRDDDGGPGGDRVRAWTRSRQFWMEKSAPFEPENDWISDHPAYKLEITVNGDRGTLHFECHYVDVKTGEVVCGHGRRLRRGPDRREVADHEHGRRNDRPGSLRSWPRSTRARGSPGRGGDGSAIRSSGPSPACRSRFGRSS